MLAPVPALTIFRRMKLPLALLIASTALLVVGVVRMELAQARDRGGAVSAPVAHP